MEETNESNVKVLNICHKCCSALERKTGRMKFRREHEPDNHYPGTLSPVEYFWCGVCRQAYMSPEQCEKDFTRGQARNGKLVFVLAPLQTPAVPVHVVNWLNYE